MIDAVPDTAPAARRPGRWARIIWVLCLIYAVFVMAENVQEAAWNIGRQPGAGTLGAIIAPPTGTSGYLVVSGVAPDGALAKVAVKNGDQLRFDRSYDWIRRSRVGERIGISVMTPTGPSHRIAITVAAKPAPLTADVWLGILYDAATALAALIGAFIVWRGGGSASTLLLGMGLMTYGLITYTPQVAVSSPTAFPPFFIAGLINLIVIPPLFYRFAMQFYSDQVGPVRRVEKTVFWIYTGFMAALGLTMGATNLQAITAPVIGTGEGATTLASYVGFGACFYYLIRGWRRSLATAQQRYALMLVATGAIIIAQSFDYLSSSLGSVLVHSQTTFDTIHFATNALLTGVVGAGLFAYSILRHRVFDLGFALNRTLVYGVVSALLLAVFGLIEWAVDHLLAIEGREKNALIDAAIAVAVFLTFHRVRDFVEHAVESLFFRRWQKAEQALRRFVREAPFFTDSAALLRASAKALGAYADGAGCAIYLLRESGYAHAAGEFADAPAMLEPDLSVLVSLRAVMKPTEIDDGPLKGALAAPMINRNEVIGVAVVTPKPTGGAWRPDEIELIGWATVQVGLDLHALKLESLTKSEIELRRENATLRSLIPQRA
ncbi:MAG TPA: hypothetical protein VGL66_11295 [Caulobacteraceae bacterium]|jgi:hypothetical protein